MSDSGLLKRISNLDEVNVLEEIDELQPVGEESDFDSIPLPESVLECLAWLESNENSVIPQAVIDDELKVRWRNDAYRRFRETPGLTYNYRDRTFDSFFTSFTGGSSNAKIRRTGLLAALANPETGYSWQGNVEGTGPKLRRFIARITITPESCCRDGSPRFYRVTVDNITQEYQHLIHSNFEGMLRASLLKDEDTGNHIKRVNAYSRYLSASLLERKESGDLKWIDIDGDFVDSIGELAAFHDVGKIGVREAVLQKPGKLDDQEWEEMKEHPLNGAFLLSSHPKAMARDIALNHHEKWDGSGYPFGLKGEDIPLCGRIVALADVYDALRTRRPYKEPFSEEKTVSIIMEGAGAHFDPNVISAFRDMRKEFDRVFRELGDD